jgi:putative thioredoxin
MIDVTDANFETEVLQRSMTNPVVVDLWAPWCGPCRTLGPMIEKIVDETDGKVALAKINVDENPQASAAFRVQSIPAVYALSKGQVVDGFIGAQPEAKIREFVNGLIADEIGAELAALVAVGDELSLRRAVELDPTFKPAALALAQLLLDTGRAAEVLEALEALPEDDDTRALAEAARAGALPTGERSRIEARLEELIGSVKTDDEARTEYLGLLDELAVGDPAAAASWRKQLAARLF